MPGPRDDQFDDEALTTPITGGDELTSAADSPPPGRVPSESDRVRLQPLAARYDVLQELGRGGMGVVYRARDRETGDIVALKVLLPEISANKEVIERFKSELLLARKVTHKNVCRVHDLVRFGDLAVISMEYIEGESLRAVLRRKQGVAQRQALEWARQMCAALTEAHAQGVVHRDLKPENILIARDGTIKVMDFGIARSLDASATHKTGGAIIGTPAYMSPEQAQGKPTDHRSDIYSLGLIVYEMAVGRPAFTAESSTGLLHKHITEEPQPLGEVAPDLPAYLDRAVRKCLEKKPARRYSSVEQLLAALGPQIETETDAVLRELPLRLRVWQRVDWALVALGLAGAIVFFSLVGRVYPFAGMQLQISDDAAIQLARSIVQKVAPEHANDTYEAIRGAAYPMADGLSQEMLSNGLEKAIQKVAAEDQWYIVGYRPGRREGASIHLNDRGKLTAVNVSWQGEPEKVLSVQEAQPLAARFAEEFLELRLAGLNPLPLVLEGKRWVVRDSQGKETNYFSNPALTPVVWELQEPSGTVRRVSILVHGKSIKSAYSSRLVAEQSRGWWSGGPTMARWRNAIALGVFVPFVFCLISLAVFLVRRFYQRRWAAALRASALVSALMTASFWLTSPAQIPLVRPLWWIFVPLALVGFFLVSYALLSVAQYYLSRTLPEQLSSTVAMLREGWRARPAGLAILRGMLLGTALLGGQVTLLWFLGERKLAVPAMPFLTGLLYTAEVPVIVACLATVVAIFLSWQFIGLPLALLRRATSRTGVAVAATVGLWMAGTLNVPGGAAYPTTAMYCFSGLHALALVAVLLRYDLLTCTTATLTVTTGLVCLPAYQIYAQVDPWAAAGLAPLGLLAAFGLLTWLWPQVIAGVGRVRAAFE